MDHDAAIIGSSKQFALCTYDGERGYQPILAVWAEMIRECAEVSFVPGEKSENKDTQPLRCLAIRIRQQQENLFDDGSKVRHFAVVTNIREWKARRLIE